MKQDLINLEQDIDNESQTTIVSNLHSDLSIKCPSFHTNNTDDD